MIQAPADSAGALQTILAEIVAELRPRRVYLFGSRARGDARIDSDYDFIIEVERVSTAEKIAIEKLKAAHSESGYRIDAHLREANRIEQRMNDPGTTDWDVAREGMLVFLRPDLTPIARPPASVKEPPPGGPPPSAREWMEIAEFDLYRAAHHLSDELEDWSDEVCYFSQQSAEKALKALIVSLNVRPPRSHDICKLIAVIRNSGVPLAEFEPQCHLLSGYAVAPRYPGSVITRSEAREAVSAAGAIVAAVRAFLP